MDADISSLEASIAAAEKEIQERSGGSLDADAVNAAKQVETVRMELASVGGRRREVATNIATLRESMAEKKFTRLDDDVTPRARRSRATPAAPLRACAKTAPDTS